MQTKKILKKQPNINILMSNMPELELSSYQKALKINLDKSKYGTFAEIGAGQDVAATFFKAGGASGTIAKSMSAYDMKFSDAIYGPVNDGRYVCQPRLISMLDHEYNLLIERLDEQRGENTQFFSFSNTVVALNYHKNNQPHGWLGCRFQLEPRGKFHEVVVHIRMLDNDTLMQQQALGVIGTNLIYGCFYHWENPENLLESLRDGLNRDRIQIDMIQFEGEAFEKVDGRLMSLRLVKNGFCDLALFGPDGKILQPSDSLYKKHIVVLRGRFRPIINVHLDMLENGVKQFVQEADVDKDKMVVVTELTLKSLQQENENEEINEKDFLDRVDILCSMGQTVMISNYVEYYKLVAYLSKITKLKIGLIIGFPNLEYIFQEENYKDLPGEILESFATLFSRKVKLFVYPTLRNGMIMNCMRFNPPAHLNDLFRYLIANNKIEDIYHYNRENLKTYTNDMLKLIQTGEPGWEENVPEEVVKMIKDRCLFGFPCVVIPKS